MIDLHLHTTASDGLLAPRELVQRVARAGVMTLAVTDHDTVRGLDEARAAAEAAGLRFVNGIEITAVESGRDVHVLGYFFDPEDAGLRQFLAGQYDDRLRRVRLMAERLAELGLRVDIGPLLARAAERGATVGRPHLAAALVSAGHVRSRDEAFDRYLDRRGPAFVARQGADVAHVVRVIAAAGGVASLAHPGLTRVDDLISSFASNGLHAIEAHHSDHDPSAERHYRALAAAHGLAVSGGSDYHGDDSHHRCGLGRVSLSPEDYRSLEARRP